MKNYLSIVVLGFLLCSCGSKKKPDANALANEVCECRNKTLSMKTDDPEAKKIRLECSKLQGDNFGKIGTDEPAKEVFTKRLNECNAEWIEKHNAMMYK